MTFRRRRAWFVIVPTALAACGSPYAATDPSPEASVPTPSVDASSSDSTVAADTSPADAVAFDAPVNAPPPAPSLFAWYRFEESSGPVVNSGSAGTVIDGVAGAGTTRSVPGRVGKALHFGGAASTSIVTIPTSPVFDVKTALTMEAWIRPLSSASTTIVTKVDNVQYGGFLFRQQDVFVVFTGMCRTDGICATPASPASTLHPNSWTHIAMTYDAKNVVLFVNGALSSSQSNPGVLGANNVTLRFGQDDYGAFVGDLDEVKIWNVVRTPAEICTDAGGSAVSGGCSFPP